ncbi:ROK family protein [Paenibacillus sp. MER TA 81-3]|uniref:ROK family protein n=1 Tax=Paenibacillus sp. MER TA 81-3 TaxID=2939573 RepID=UPI00203DB600|nr:ROK family protein [Paenibacillus sp. MER TA 81-3]MCM3338638.1 ROK family protein [Paenibacillus sp. MER TA 81-3]
MRGPSSAAHCGSAPAPQAVTLALDAGGTALKAAVVAGGRLVPNVSGQWPSRSEGDAASIVASFADACRELLGAYAAAGPARPEAPMRIGFAFPGPFDYEAGVSRLQGLGKYDRLYGVNVRDALRAEFSRRAASGEAWAVPLANADVRFENDATLFALGLSRLHPHGRLLCLTLGTGLGSAFIEAGRPVAGRSGVPDSGMLYAEAYRGRLVDEQFGRRGILELAELLDARCPDQDVRDLAEAARGGDTASLHVFREFGTRFAEMLSPYIHGFRPHRLILGGQIAKSADLFAAELNALLQPCECELQTNNQVMEYTYLGIDALFQ